MTEERKNKMYICPKCNEELMTDTRSYRCKNGHCFDISSSGYVNLLLSSHHGNHGDNKLMLQSRRSFLSLGYYRPIADELFNILSSLSARSEAIRILDAGCGEGYYTGALCERFTASEQKAEIYGIDVSKIGITMAAKKYKQCDFCVASVNALPFPNGYFDIVVSLFAPISEKEFYRVLSDGGMLVTVSPSPRHLLGLKKSVYDSVYENEQTTFTPKLFGLTSESSYCGSIVLEDAKAIRELFTMTPYYYKTDDIGKSKLYALDKLETEIGVNFYCFKKQAELSASQS